MNQMVFVDRINSEFEETGFGLYAVEIKETGEFIGYVGFHRFAFDVLFHRVGNRLANIR